MAKKKATKKAVKKATKKAVKKVAKKVTKKAAKKVTKKVAKKVAKKVTKKVAKKATKKVAPKVTKKAAPKPAKKAAPKMAPKMVSRPMPKAAPKATESASVIKSPTLARGDVAPLFTLPDQNGNMVSLSDFKGMNVVVYFYPKAMTPGCTTQACGLRDAEEKMKDAEVVVLGISADPVKKLKQFEEKEHLNFRLLSDEKLDVIKAYGVWGPKKFMGKEYDGIMRQSFLIDREGRIVHVIHKVDTNSHHDDVLRIFKHQE